MRRVAAVVLLVAAAAAFAVVALGAGDDGGDYKVRAIFENAGFVIPGEDVKAAGVKVGKIDAVEVTGDFKAAVVLDITDEGYQDFRQDAECLVRPQSLIGERFVECELTQARAAGTDPPPALERIDEGAGDGQYLLPVERNGKSVDADPALREVDEVLEILARQNDRLADLAVDSDTIMRPLARERRRVSGALTNMSEVAEATAERRADLEADIERLPTFLRELRPTMVRLGALSDEMTPVLSDLGEVAPDINRLVLQLGPFASAARPALASLGEAAEAGIPAVRAARPVVRDLRGLARAVRPVGANARRVLESFQRTGGINRLMDYIFYQVAAINGFDSFGHYLRAGLLVNQCSNYAITAAFGCSANFSSGGASAASLPSGQPRDPVVQQTAAALARALGLPGGDVPAPEPQTAPELPVAPAPSATPTPTPTPTPAPTDPLLDYLFGDEG
jgi:phospholipid/cholesterol/gamma-HCH transport system substrate-binding protein